MMIVDFFASIACLKSVPRSGWSSKLGIQNPESVADHSYMTSLMSAVLADIEGLDTLKVVRMSLLHDAAESRTGDLMPGEVTLQEKKRLEETAMDVILQDLPEPARGIYMDTWSEFQAGASEEARFVHEVDKLEMALQARIYSDRASTEQLAEFFESARSSIQNQHLQNILEQILSP